MDRAELPGVGGEGVAAGESVDVNDRSVENRRRLLGVLRGGGLVALVGGRGRRLHRRGAGERRRREAYRWIESGADAAGGAGGAGWPLVGLASGGPVEPAFAPAFDAPSAAGGRRASASGRTDDGDRLRRCPQAVLGPGSDRDADEQTHADGNRR